MNIWFSSNGQVYWEDSCFVASTPTAFGPSQSTVTLTFLDGCNFDDKGRAMELPLSGQRLLDLRVFPNLALDTIISHGFLALWSALYGRETCRFAVRDLRTS